MKSTFNKELPKNALLYHKKIKERLVKLNWNPKKSIADQIIIIGDKETNMKDETLKIIKRHYSLFGWDLILISNRISETGFYFYRLVLRKRVET